MSARILPDFGRFVPACVSADLRQTLGGLWRLVCRQIYAKLWAVCVPASLSPDLRQTLCGLCAGQSIARFTANFVRFVCRPVCRQICGNLWAVCAGACRQICANLWVVCAGASVSRFAANFGRFVCRRVCLQICAKLWAVCVPVGLLADLRQTLGGLCAGGSSGRFAPNFGGLCAGGPIARFAPIFGRLAPAGLARDLCQSLGGLCRWAWCEICANLCVGCRRDRCRRISANLCVVPASPLASTRQMFARICAGRGECPSPIPPVSARCCLRVSCRVARCISARCLGSAARVPRTGGGCPRIPLAPLGLSAVFARMLPLMDCEFVRRFTRESSDNRARAPTTSTSARGQLSRWWGLATA